MTLEIEKEKDELAELKARIAYPVQNATPVPVSISLNAATEGAEAGFETLAQWIGEILKEEGQPIFECDSHGDEFDTGRVIQFSDAERDYLEEVKRWYEHCALLAQAMNHGLSDLEVGDLPELPEDSLGVRLFTGRY